MHITQVRQQYRRHETSSAFQSPLLPPPRPVTKSDLLFNWVGCLDNGSSAATAAAAADHKTLEMIDPTDDVTMEFFRIVFQGRNSYSTAVSWSKTHTQVDWSSGSAETTCRLRYCNTAASSCVCMHLFKPSVCFRENKWHEFRQWGGSTHVDQE